MAAGSKEDRPSGLNEETMEELMRKGLHAQIDEIFIPGLTSAEISLGCLKLSGQLIEAAAPLFDVAVGNQLVSSAQTTLTDPADAGERFRNEVKALVLGLPGPTAVSTADAGLLGASTLIGYLAATSGNPYLQVLANALSDFRYGQVHPWLDPPKARVHPPQHAKRVLELKAVPFCAIEYLVASGQFRTKTEAKAEVVERLNISEETLNDWRKQQRSLHAPDFDHRIKYAGGMGRQVMMYRSKEKTSPEMRILIDSHDNYFGLPSVDRAGKELKNLGAYKGQK